MNGTRILCASCRRAAQTREISVQTFQIVRRHQFYSTLANSDMELGNSYMPRKLSQDDITYLAHKCTVFTSILFSLLVRIPSATKVNNLVTIDHVDQTQTLHGWLVIPKRKVSKDLQFFQLRDSQGNIIQLYSSKHLPSEILS